jgi:hypothetical protein
MPRAFTLVEAERRDEALTALSANCPYTELPVANSTVVESTEDEYVPRLDRLGADPVDEAFALLAARRLGRRY